MSGKRVSSLDDGTPLYAPVGTLPVDNQGEHVQCHLCGRWLRQLTAGHLRSHGLDGVEYRRLLGLKRTNPLQAPELSRRRATIMRRQIASDPRVQNAHLLAERPTAPRHRTVSPEELAVRRAAGPRIGRRRSQSAQEDREERARALGSTDLAAFLAERYGRQGLSLAAVARELRTSPQTVRRDLAASGVPLRDPRTARIAGGPRARAQRHRERRERRLRELGFATIQQFVDARRSAGVKRAAIAAELGVHERTLRRLLARTEDRLS